MIWFILALLVAIVFCVYYVVTERPGIGDAIGSTLLATLLLCACAVVASMCAGLVCTPLAETEYALTESKEIVALNDNSAVSGRFFLGTGRVDEEMKYYFIEETEKGKHMNSVNSKNTYIVESNEETPRVCTYVPKWKNRWMYWIALPMKPNERRIYVPKDSVTTDFTVDLS